MANISSSTLFKTTICIFLLAISFDYASGSRILVDTTEDVTSVAPVAPLPTNQPDTTDPIDEDDLPEENPTPTLPSGQIPAVVAPAPVVNPVVPLPSKTTPSVTTPTTTTVAPVATPIGATSTTGSGVGGATSGVGVVGTEHPTLSFFMHDVLGGSHATSRVVTGIVATSAANAVPFSQPNSQVFPITGGVPLNNINGIVNNNNLPFLAGFNGNSPNNPNSNTVLQNTGNNNVVNGGNNLPFVSAGQLPAGITLQQLMFGSITVIDNELTEGHELGTGVLGQGQGFYLSSSLDGSSHTFALTTLFHGNDHDVEEDTISFFGVHRTASEISHIAVIGGTGKYEDAKGYATIETLPQVDQHTTDGVETIVHVNVYLTTA